MSEPVTSPHKVERLIWLLLAIMIVFIIGMSIRRVFFPDEFDVMQTAWKIYEGQSIYIDFFQLHHPFVYYSLYPLFTIYGTDLEILQAARFVFLAQLFAIYALVYLIALEVCDRVTAVASVFFLAAMTVYTESGIEIRPDVPQTLFALLGIYLLFRYLRLRRLGLLVASGLSLAVAFLFLQKIAVMILLVGLMVLLRTVQRDVSPRDFLVFCAAQVAGLVPYATYLALSGTLDTFIFYNFTFPAVMFQMVGRDWGGLLANGARVAVLAGLVVVLFLASVARRVPKDRRQWEVVWLGVGWMAWTVVSGRHLSSYYLPGLPFIAIAAAQALMPVLGGHRRLLPAALALTLVLPALSYSRHIIRGREAQMDRIRYVHAVAAPDEYVYDGEVRFNLFRKDVGFVYFATSPTNNRVIETMQLLRGYEYDPYELIDRYEPRIISDIRIDVSDPRIAEFYEPVPEYEGMYVRRATAVGRPDRRDGVTAAAEEDEAG